MKILFGASYDFYAPSGMNLLTVNLLNVNFTRIALNIVNKSYDPDSSNGKEREGRRISLLRKKIVCEKKIVWEIKNDDKKRL